MMAQNDHYVPKTAEDAASLERAQQDEQFVKRYWRRISRDKAQQLVEQRGAGNYRMMSPWAHYYVCAKFDMATSSCLAYEERPPICSGYPWYPTMYAPIAEWQPEQLVGQLCSLRCDYWTDVPKESRPPDVLLESLIA